MRKKTLLFLLIVFTVVGLISHFVTPLEAQIVPNAVPPAEDDSFPPCFPYPDCLCDPVFVSGSIVYLGTGCSWKPEDKMDLYRLTDPNNPNSYIYIMSASVTRDGADFKGIYAFPKVAGGVYKVVPNLRLATTNGVSPAYRYYSYDGCHYVGGVNDYNVNGCIQQ